MAGLCNLGDGAGFLTDRRSGSGSLRHPLQRSCAAKWVLEEGGSVAPLDSNADVVLETGGFSSLGPLQGLQGLQGLQPWRPWRGLSSRPRPRGDGMPPCIAVLWPRWLPWRRELLVHRGLIPRCSSIDAACSRLLSGQIDLRGNLQSF